MVMNDVKGLGNWSWTWSSLENGIRSGRWLM